MASISQSDVQWFLSNSHASSGYQGVGTAGASLGGYMSTTQVNYSVALDDLFLDISAAQNAAGQVDYQCLFVMNNTATGLIMKLPYIWVPWQTWTSGGAAIAIGADPLGPVPYNSSSVQAAVIGSAYNAPTGVTWSSAPHQQFPSGVLIGSLPAQYCCAIWIRRTATNSAQLLPQSFSVQCTFVTDA